jgi:hypothetical protein
MWNSLSLVLLVMLVVLCGTRQLSAQDAPASQQEAIRNLQARVDELRAQMTAIQAQLDALRGTALPSPGSIVSTPAPPEPRLSPEQHAAAIGEATAEHHTFAEDEEDAPRLYNAPLESELPGFFLLPGTRTLLRLDGSIRSDFIYDPRATVLADAFITSSIPVPLSGGPGNFTMSTRGSRVSTDFRIPVGDTGAARTFLQLDFFGPNGTTAPRVRHLYAQMDNILVGQTFTNFMDPDAFADTLDPQGANSGISARIPQARYSFALGNGASGAVAVELPASSIAFSVDGLPALPTTPAPDGTMRVRNEWKRGHLQLAGVFRDLGVQLPDGSHESAFGWGVNATGGVTVYARNNVVMGLAYGHGMARYVADTGGLGMDAAPRTQMDLSLRALPVVATYGSYQHYWSPAVRSNATFGFVQLQNTDFQPGNTFHQSKYSSVNLIWTAVGTFDLGGEFLYGWVTQKSGAHASDPRFQLTGRYSFVKLHPKQ